MSERGIKVGMAALTLLRNFVEFHLNIWAPVGGKRRRPLPCLAHRRLRLCDCKDSKAETEPVKARHPMRVNRQPPRQRLFWVVHGQTPCTILSCTTGRPPAAEAGK